MATGFLLTTLIAFIIVILILILEKKNKNMNTANVIAAICSFFIPGLGQLVQGRLMKAIIYFISTILLWFIFMGWLPHLISIISAAKYNPNK